MSPLRTMVAKSILEYLIPALSYRMPHLTTCVAGTRFPLTLLGSVWPLAETTLYSTIALRLDPFTLA